VSFGETNRNDAELQSRATHKSCKKVIGADEDNSHRRFRLGGEILLILKLREFKKMAGYGTSSQPDRFTDQQAATTANSEDQ